jgi:hypothetical protein
VRYTNLVGGIPFTFILPSPSMSQPTTTLPTEDLADMLIYAFRYTLGRRTYSTSTMSEHLRTYWEALPLPWQQLVQREIREAIESKCAGDECDIQTWRTVLALSLKVK